MAGLMLDTEKRKKAALRCIIFTFLCLHVWGSQLVWTATHAKPDDVDFKAIVSMFSTITWGIGIALLALVSDKIFELAITKAAEKFGVSTKEITEEKTSTKIIEKQPTEPNTSSDTSTS